MIILLRDDLFIETFESPDQPPDWIEFTDVENGAYAFSDEFGQLFRGKLKQRGGLFQHERWCLVPTGEPNKRNLHDLLDRATGIDIDRCAFADLTALRRYLSADQT